MHLCAKTLRLPSIYPKKGPYTPFNPKQVTYTVHIPLFKAYMEGPGRWEVFCCPRPVVSNVPATGGSQQGHSTFRPPSFNLGRMVTGTYNWDHPVLLRNPLPKTRIFLERLCHASYFRTVPSLHFSCVVSASSSLDATTSRRKKTCCWSL